MASAPHHEALVPDGHDAAKVYVEFQARGLTETAMFLYRGMAFYLAIVAAVTSYVLTQDIPPDRKNIFIFIGITVSFLAAVASGLLMWGLYTGLRDLRLSMETLHPETFKMFGLEAFFKRGRIAFLGVGACSFCVLAVFAVGMAMLVG